MKDKNGTTIIAGDWCKVWFAGERLTGQIDFIIVPDGTLRTEEFAMVKGRGRRIVTWSREIEKLSDQEVFRKKLKGNMYV